MNRTGQLRIIREFEQAAKDNPYVYENHDDEGFTPLSRQVLEQNLLVVKHILAHAPSGLDIILEENIDRVRSEPLSIAAFTGNLELFTYLFCLAKRLPKFNDLNLTQSLFFSASNNHLHILSYIVSNNPQGKKILDYSHKRYTLFEQIIAMANVETLEYVLSNSSQSLEMLHKKNIIGENPLERATRQKRSKIVEWLILKEPRYYGLLENALPEKTVDFLGPKKIEQLKARILFQKELSDANLHFCLPENTLPFEICNVVMQHTSLLNYRNEQ